MLKQRNKVFETNSSSTHCITVSDRKDWKCDLPITVKPAWYGEFGWEWETWSSVEEKLAYMIRCLIAYDYTEKTLQDKIKPTYNEWLDGYVDHEDWYQEEMEDIYNNDNDLLNFLLSEYSYIEGGNDN